MSTRRSLCLSMICTASAVLLFASSAAITHNNAFLSSGIAGAGAAESATANEPYGPENLLRTMKTPFTANQEPSNAPAATLAYTHAKGAPLSLQSARSPLHLLSNRLLAPRVYLPGRMVIGSTAEFIIKGRPGCWAALAMADRNSGAKPIYGHELHLGPDRKLVSLGQIPDTGVLSLVIDTPIQGDLIGQPLFFEVAIWSKPDFSDLELATPVPSESTVVKLGERNNGVIVAAEPDHRRGVRIVPDGTVQLRQMQGNAGIDSGRP